MTDKQRMEQIWRDVPCFSPLRPAIYRTLKLAALIVDIRCRMKLFGA